MTVAKPRTWANLWTKLLDDRDVRALVRKHGVSAAWAWTALILVAKRAPKEGRLDGPLGRMSIDDLPESLLRDTGLNQDRTITDRREADWLLSNRHSYRPRTRSY